ncbi:MAG TPA: SGNH/GDSL hydrolase family protein [Candidatus Saccharimonadales bacterium]|nr:SGNH/GDSL hydrolase family protein [Candidatus Saccharimonadales bacterium]
MKHGTAFLLLAVLLAIVGIGSIAAYLAYRPGSPTMVPMEKEESETAQAIRYLPLGDSYTIGQSVSETERWPNQLAARLAAKDIRLNIVANPAVTGYTTQDLIDRELPLVARLQPEFVTIAIGVNDYVQGVSAAQFAANLDYIIATVQKQLPRPGAIVLVTIPDFGVTPAGSRFGSPQDIAAGIEKFNAIIKQRAAHYQLPVADVYDISKQAANDPALTAPDGLHPSAKAYAQWTDIIFNTIITTGVFDR